MCLRNVFIFIKHYTQTTQFIAWRPASAFALFPSSRAHTYRCRARNEFARLSNRRSFAEPFWYICAGRWHTNLQQTSNTRRECQSADKSMAMMLFGLRLIVASSQIGFVFSLSLFLLPIKHQGSTHILPHRIRCRWAIFR